MIVIGSIMPKLQMNSVIGLRTHWSIPKGHTVIHALRAGGLRPLRYKKRDNMEEKPTVWREIIYHSWNPYDIGLLFYKGDCLLSVVDGHLACLPPH